jgi:hypothetical protein
MANNEKEPILTVSTPGYEGPERRKEVEVVVKKCFCHAEHQRRLNGFDKGSEDNRGDHKLMWIDIKDKIDKKLFYIFVAIVVGGLAFVYNGIHNVAVNLAIVATKQDDQGADLNRLRNQLESHNRNNGGYKPPSHYYNPNQKPNP